MHHRTIQIQPEAAMQTVEPPRLEGEPALVRLVLVALEQAISSELGRPVPAGVWLRELHIDGEEAVLALAPELHRPELVQVAFETLRGLLPDTDIYVGTAAH